MNREREPAFNAPWPALVLIGALLAGYALQLATSPYAAFARFGFSPAQFEAGHRAALVTALFVHGSWAHALVNAAGVLAFGTPVARYFGLGALGGLAFFGFYLACGALASLGYAFVHAGDATYLVGASGAVSGFWGAASRLIAGYGRPGPFLSAPVVGMAAAVLVINLILAVAGFAPGSGGARIAWEAHLFGYAAGLFLIGPFGALLRRP